MIDVDIDIDSDNDDKKGGTREKLSSFGNDDDLPGVIRKLGTNMGETQSVVIWKLLLVKMSQSPEKGLHGLNLFEFN
ncbi:predicted protein [Sclerotinia sclerotiorum 1980 UF-70]|uniref:Uncharacterized protein n=1 Tax=Sclerotinia sclerotiorum (strain ATCC 18683 / 1980 / Ss-1) TaxID=665079 RepID=A7ECW1_SCLS1|nr:predicted protein [Sclerotinia sclerotiorum 1980 UF-70]EDO00677.1 predicted protein [Sclerotinia sclerotiorum 1980 UF-70]